MCFRPSVTYYRKKTPTAFVMLDAMWTWGESYKEHLHGQA